MEKNHGIFKDVINEYLEGYAEKDQQFKEKMSKEGKSIEKCCDYIISQVKKSGRCGFADAEIFGMAIHYYDEDNLEFESNNDSVKVIVNKEVKEDDLTENEKEDARELAKKKFAEKLMKEMEEKNKKRMAKPKKDDSLQLSLF